MSNLTGLINTLQAKGKQSLLFPNGSLSVLIRVQSAGNDGFSSGGFFSINGSSFSGGSAISLKPGWYDVVFNPVPGHLGPASSRVAVFPGGSASVSAVFYNHGYVMYNAHGNVVASGEILENVPVGNPVIYVYAGGRLSNVQVTSASVEIFSGGMLSNASLLAGVSCRVHEKGLLYEGEARQGAVVTVLSGGMASGVSFLNNGSAVIMSGGSCVDAHVSSGGTLHVSSGGMTKNVYYVPGDGGVIEYDDKQNPPAFITPYSGVVIINDEMTAADGIHLPDIVVDSGIALTVKDNAVIRNASVLNGGSVKVLENGLGQSTVINSGGVMEVQCNGIVNSTVVNNSGLLNVHSGGEANTTVINEEGIVNVYSYGKVNDVTVNNGGYLNMEKDASANMMSIRGTVMASDGIVNNASIEDSGLLQTHSLANNVEIRPGGNLIVGSEGTVNGLAVNGGQASIGGNAEDIIINDGSVEAIGGTVSNAVVTSGTLNISSGSGANVNVSNSLFSIKDGEISTLAVISGEAILESTIASNIEVSAGGNVFISGGEASAIIIDYADLIASSASIMDVSGCHGRFEINEGTTIGLDLYDGNAIFNDVVISGMNMSGGSVCFNETVITSAHLSNASASFSKADGTALEMCDGSANFIDVAMSGLVLSNVAVISGNGSFANVSQFGGGLSLNNAFVSSASFFNGDANFTSTGLSDATFSGTSAMVVDGVLSGVTLESGEFVMSGRSADIVINDGANTFTNVMFGDLPVNGGSCCFMSCDLAGATTISGGFVDIVGGAASNVTLTFGGEGIRIRNNAKINKGGFFDGEAIVSNSVLENCEFDCPMTMTNGSGLNLILHNSSINFSNAYLSGTKINGKEFTNDGNVSMYNCSAVFTDVRGTCFTTNTTMSNIAVNGMLSAQSGRLFAVEMSGGTMNVSSAFMSHFSISEGTASICSSIMLDVMVSSGTLKIIGGRANGLLMLDGKTNIVSNALVSNAIVSGGEMILNGVSISGFSLNEGTVSMVDGTSAANMTMGGGDLWLE